MTLHAQVKYVLELVEQSPYPELHTVSAQEARDIFEETAPALNVRPEDVYRTEDRWIDAVEGDILIRIYTPYQPKTGEKLPILVFYHLILIVVVPLMRLIFFLLSLLSAFVSV